MLISIVKTQKKRTFVATVHTTLPFRTASQGVSFALYTFLLNSFLAYVY
ncbi:protein of unknown function [Tenacibaculum aestuariivivum]